MMWPFKRKFLVAIDECFELVKQAYMNSPDSSKSIYEFIEDEYGVKRKWSWKTRTNYLVFNSEQEYTWFLLKL